MKALLSDELWAVVRPLLPAHPKSPKGGAPRCNDRACLEGILYVLRGGIAWRLLPKEIGASYSTCWRRFHEWTLAGIWDQVHAKLLTALGKAKALSVYRVIIDSASVRAIFGGAHTGPNPTDRSKNGCKRHVICDSHGIPLVVLTGPANQRDEEMVAPMLDQFPEVINTQGKNQQQPKALQGDRGYGFPWIIAMLVTRMIRSLLAPRGSPHGSGLGKTRYVIERTMAWFDNYRRLRMCYERTGTHFQAFNVLAACVMCSNRLRQK